MRIYWWQGGVFLHPQSTRELQALGVLTEALKTAKIGRDPEDEIIGVPPKLEKDGDLDDYEL